MTPTKRCPCCGGVGTPTLVMGSRDSGHFVRCDACGLRTASCSSEAEAIARWDNRAEESGRADEFTVIGHKLDEIMSTLERIAEVNR